MIIRTEIEGRMEKYFRYVFFDRELTLKDKGVLLTLLGLPKDLSFSITEVEKHVPEKSTAIRTSLQKLEKKGYIRRWLVRDERNVRYVEATWKCFSRMPSANRRTIKNDVKDEV